MTNGTFKAKRLDMLFAPSDRSTGDPDLFVVKTIQGEEKFYALVKSTPVMETTPGKRYVTLDGTDGYHEITHMTLGPAKLHFV